MSNLLLVKPPSFDRERSISEKFLTSQQKQIKTQKMRFYIIKINLQANLQRLLIPAKTIRIYKYEITVLQMYTFLYIRTYCTFKPIYVRNLTHVNLVI